jgi:hypothetical protein
MNTCHFEPKARNLKFPFPPGSEGESVCLEGVRGEAAETANGFGSRANS